MDREGLGLGLTVAVAILVGAAIVLTPIGAEVEPTAPARLAIRCDDSGMCHTVNMALKKFIETGLPFSTSVMFACPWYLEAVEILRGHPEISVGIHLTLNSEWEHYKWGPVLGKEKVPSLVDERGHFFSSEAEFAARDVDLGEVEAELRAQIERALGTGLRIDYLDYHMRVAISTPELRAIVERLAEEYGLGLAQYLGETSTSIWDVAPEKKLPRLLELVDQAKPGETTLTVIHLGLESPELAALVDLNNPSDPYRVAKHRQAELEAITSPAFRDALARRGIELVTYREIIQEVGLEAMVPPGELSGYSSRTADE